MRERAREGRGIWSGACCSLHCVILGKLVSIEPIIAFSYASHISGCCLVFVSSFVLYVFVQVVCECVCGARSVSE